MRDWQESVNAIVPQLHGLLDDVRRRPILLSRVIELARQRHVRRVRVCVVQQLHGLRDDVRRRPILLSRVVERAQQQHVRCVRGAAAARPP